MNGIANKTRKVAYIISHYPKVSHSFIRREILELERTGFEVIRIAMRGWDCELADPDDIAELDKTNFVLRNGAIRLGFGLCAEAIRHPRRFFGAALIALKMMRGSDRPIPWHLIYLAEASWIAPLIRRAGIAHLHAHFGTNPAEVAALVAALTGVTYSFTVHGPEEFDKVHSVHLARKARGAAFVVAISSYCRSQIFRVIPHSLWQKVKVIHCGLEESFFENEPPEAPLNNRLVCVGRLSEAKGQLLLVEAVGELCRDGVSVELTLVGDGELRGEIERLIERYRIGERVTITGWASGEQVRRAILDSRAVVLPSFAEGLPVVLMEALALGRPVISTYVDGTPELVVDGCTGWLVPAGSKSDLVRAIKRCLNSDGATLYNMALQGRKRVRDRHRVTVQVRLLAGLFDGVLEADRRATAGASAPRLPLAKVHETR
jgi:colanic acid/amylovoran biosynthesis glycosyltransferase